jgi:hypothetical protein
MGETTALRYVDEWKEVEVQGFKIAEGDSGVRIRSLRIWSGMKVVRGDVWIVVREKRGSRRRSSVDGLCCRNESWVSHTEGRSPAGGSAGGGQLDAESAARAYTFTLPLWVRARVTC